MQCRIQDLLRGRPKVGLLINFFCRKLHENERIRTPWGRPWRARGSANAMSCLSHKKYYIGRT